jgi:ABC-type nitrate/sulfonate/bicarbonate transport system ATPase subunit
MAFIEVRDLAKSFPATKGTRHVLKGVSLDVKHGEFVSIVGAMGSGKSTLLSLIAGLTTPDAGRVSVGGENTCSVRRDAAFVFQNYSLLPWFTALENVRLAVEATFPAMTRDEQRRHATRALEQVGLANALDRRPKQLSGGMRQRVAIARAFATKPQVLFLDEPFGALDALTREQLQHEIAGLLLRSPKTVVFITHNMDEAIFFSDRILVMSSRPTRILEEVRVALPRPREADTVRASRDYADIRKHLWSLLSQQAAVP